MAINDLVERIEGDAAAEAGAIRERAEAEAAAIVAQAQATADAERAALLETASLRSAEEAETLLANARLGVRDALLGHKRERAERVLSRAQAALEALPAAEYAELIARAIARSAAGGESLAVAAADAGRLADLAPRLKTLGVDVKIASSPAPIEHGALLTGDRVRVEVSPASLVADARDQLLVVASRELFGVKE